MALSPAEFATKWIRSQLTEKAGSQSHFRDLCDMLGVPEPTSDPTGSDYAFEKGVEKTGGGNGFADVWKKGHFAWEYKGKHKNLKAAYNQLLNYRESLENPPLLVVCDLYRFEVHTNWTNTIKETYEFTLDDLRTDPRRPLEILRAVMSDPDRLHPQRTTAEVTEEAADRFATLASALRLRGHDPERVAHFLNRILFCFFAEDAGLLPEGVLQRLLATTRGKPERFMTGLRTLFDLMANDGGLYGTEEIQWFNGGLFDSADVIDLAFDEVLVVEEAAKLDWSQVEPSILGTLFERGLDPEKRSQLGAHYTDQAKILMVVEPVVMQPLRREFDALKADIEAKIAAGTEKTILQGRGRLRTQLPNPALAEPFQAFLERLRTVRVLDPACGSGNFLYVTLRLLKDLEKEVIQWGFEELGITQPYPRVGPEAVLGIELSPYAAELARTSIWIGHIQWMIQNGYSYERNPILQKLETIECRDAILDCTGDVPKPAEWPAAEFIVGNPPFLGGWKLKQELGEVYADALRAAFAGVLPQKSDLVCYWHEKARETIARGQTKRAGLLATNSIRGGPNRKVLDRIKESGDIFMAWSDEPWVVEGAAVRVSIVGQDDGSQSAKALDGHEVAAIHSDLTGGSETKVDITKALRLPENMDICFQGDKPAGAFDVEPKLAREMLTQPRNANGEPNSNVVVPFVNGLDVTRRHRDLFVVDFGSDMSEKEAAFYEQPFEYIRSRVRPIRIKSPDTFSRTHWWLHQRARPAMREAIGRSVRYIATARVAKYRLFVFFPRAILPDSQLMVFARDDDYTFGVLHSRVHELWSLRMGTSLEDRPRYTPTTTFETFPFPWPLDTPDEALTPEQCAHRDAIADAARRLDQMRGRWLNPPEWVREVPDVVPELPPRLLPVDDEAAAKLKKRTLTNLYNERPTWLDNAHRDLDDAVLDAYGWPRDIEEEDLLARLLALNLQRAGKT